MHHVALLIGYGAAAVNPYLAIESVEDLARHRVYTDVEPEKAVSNVIKALGKGVLKVMSKMGVQPWLPTPGPRSSRRSAFPGRWSTATSPARRASSAGDPGADRGGGAQAASDRVPATDPAGPPVAARRW